MRRLLVPDGGGELVAVAPPVPVGTLFRRFWPDARPYRARIALGLVLVALVPAVEASQVWLFKLVVDDALVPRELGALVPLAAAFLALALVGGLVSFGDEYLSAWVGERFVLSLRRRLYANLLRQPPDVLDRRRLGDLLSRLTADVQAIESFVLGAVAEGLAGVARIVLFSAVLFYLAWDLALVALVVAPLFWLTARKFGRLIRHAAREKRRRAGSLAAVAEEGLANAVVVQAYNAHRRELERFSRENEGMLEAELAATRLRGIFAPLVELIELAGVLVVVFWGTWTLSRGELTVGGLLAFLTYLGLLYRPVRDLGTLGTSLFAASAAAERVLEVLDQSLRIASPPDAVRLQRARGEIVLDGVSFAYPHSGRPVLDSLSLRLAPGDLLVVTGPSGSGKSTFAKLLVRVLDPTAGAVRLDGHDLRELELESLRANVALLLQDSLVFDASVRDNIAYGRPGASEEEIVAAARAADAHAFVEALPEGYDTRVGQKGRRLSGGQRQRIALARLLLRDAPVVVLDEPLTGLDPAAAGRVRDAVGRVIAGRTAIVITHDAPAFPGATARLELSPGGFPTDAPATLAA